MVRFLILELVRGSKEASCFSRSEGASVMREKEGEAALKQRKRKNVEDRQKKFRKIIEAYTPSVRQNYEASAEIGPVVVAQFLDDSWRCQTSTQT
jgi:hypothetical protein